MKYIPEKGKDNFYNLNIGECPEGFQCEGRLKRKELTSYYYDYVKLFGNFYESSGSYPLCGIVCRTSLPLGNRLQNVLSSLGIGINIRISHTDGSAIYKFEIEQEKSWTTVALLSSYSEWTEEEANLLWDYYRKERLGFSRLSVLFARNETEIRQKVGRLWQEKTTNTPLNPNGILDFFPEPFGGEYVLGAQIFGNDIGEWMNSNNETGKIETGESLFDVFPKINKEGKQIKAIYYFKYSTSAETFTKLDGSTFDPETISEDQKPHLLSFLKSNMNRISSNADATEYYVWIRLEDLDDEGLYGSYYYAIGCAQSGAAAWSNRSESFLRYLMYLKSQSSREDFRALKQQTIKHAIALIMSRNMSHNLGSHVLYYTQKDLHEKSQCCDRLTSKFSRSSKIQYHLKNLLDLFQDNNCLPPICSSLKGASSIVSLLKDRTNYIAAIAEDIKYPLLPVPFKTGIWDLLTIDELADEFPSINYYLRNIVRSEGYLKDRNEGSLKLQLECTAIGEEELSRLNLALPGGIIATQAIFNIFENFIRNSAKYWILNNNDKKNDDLVFSVKVGLVDANHICIRICDNKGDAKQTANRLQAKIHNIRILDDEEQGKINKDDKGIKEMILSYLWLRSDYFTDTLSTQLFKIESGGEDRKEVIDFIESSFKYCSEGDNLCLEFHLPLYHIRKHLDEGDFNNCFIVNSLYADVITAPESIIKSHYGLTQCFPRITAGEEPIPEHFRDSVSEKDDELCSEAFELFRAISKRFPKIDEYKLIIEPQDTNRLIISEQDESLNPTQHSEVKFSNHLNTQRFNIKQIKVFLDRYLYLDSVSGGNYTKVLEQLMDHAFSASNDFRVNNWKNKVLALKIKESALTRITIIDERLFDGIKWINLNEDSEDNYFLKDSQIELTLRNIRVLNWVDNRGVAGSPSNKEFCPVEKMNVFCGNRFRSMGPFENKDENITHFLSIHLGLIEEMLNQSDNSAINEICGVADGAPLSNARVSRFMTKIQTVFSPDFICIHSGRGGLSNAFENTILKDYPFIPFVTLESAFYDSKFLLSQLFYSIKYKKIV